MTPDEQLWYALGAALMAAAAALFLWMARGRPKDAEAHHVAHVFVVLAAGVAYLAMALGQGAVLVDGRRVVLARYAAWTFTAPTLALTLALTAMGSAARRPALVLGLMMSAAASPLCGAFAALSPMGARWAWYVVGCGFLAAVYALVWGELRREVEGQPSATVTHVWYANATLLSGLWMLYPLAWAFADTGARIVSGAREAQLFLGVDVLTLVVYGVLALRRAPALEPHADHYRAIVETIPVRDPDQAPAEHALREHVRRERKRRERMLGAR